MEMISLHGENPHFYSYFMTLTNSIIFFSDKKLCQSVILLQCYIVKGYSMSITTDMHLQDKP